MHKVFLSKKHEETEEHRLLKTYLERCFIKCWLDETDLIAGSALSQEFYNAIREYNIFIPLVTEKYLDSKICKQEYDYAYDQQIRERCLIIPLTMGDRNAILKKAEEKNWLTIAHLIETGACVHLDINNREAAHGRIADAIQKNSLVTFSPIQYVEVEGMLIQRIEYLTVTDRESLNFNVVKELGIDFNEFIELDPKKSRSIKKNMPIAIHARGPGWLVSYFAIQFSGKYTVYMYNEHYNAYLCIYSPGKPSDVGSILKA